MVDDMINDQQVCKQLENIFINIYKRQNKENGRWATNELEWLILNKHREKFNNLSDDIQWEIRTYLLSLRGIYGEKERNDL